jgi:hypothetical protein
MKGKWTIKNALTKAKNPPKNTKMAPRFFLLKKYKNTLTKNTKKTQNNTKKAPKHYKMTLKKIKALLSFLGPFWGALVFV